MLNILHVSNHVFKFSVKYVVSYWNDFHISFVIQHFIGQFMQLNCCCYTFLMAFGLMVFMALLYRTWWSAYKDGGIEKSHPDDVEWWKNAVTVDDSNTFCDAFARSYSEEDAACVLGSSSQIYSRWEDVAWNDFGLWCISKGMILPLIIANFMKKFLVAGSFFQCWHWGRWWTIGFHIPEIVWWDHGLSIALCLVLPHLQVACDKETYAGGFTGMPS